VTPTTAPAIWSVAAITIVSAEPRPMAITPPSAAPSENDPTLTPTAVVNTWP
jgi:hypothetical protein